MDINEEFLSKLVERYTPPDIPPCSVCGGKLERNGASAFGGKFIIYRCGNVNSVEQMRVDWSHFEKSRFSIARSGTVNGWDEEVVALVEAYRKLKESST